MSSTTPLLTNDEIHQLSATLVAARNTGRTLNKYPGSVPATLEDGYAIQDLSLKASTEEIVGWKIGMVPPELRAAMQVDRLMAPVFKSLSHIVGKAHDHDEKIAMPVFDGGFIAVEAELILELAEDIAPGSVNTADGVEQYVKAAYAGIEIASSPVPDLNDYGPAAIISDFGNNNGMIVGAPIEDWQSKLAGIETQVFINGALINAAPANNVLNGQMAALAYIIDCAAQRGITLKAGEFICSGAITGVHETVVGATSTVSFGEAGKLNVEFVAI